VRITGFRIGDGRAVVDAWRRALPADPLSEQRFRNLILLDSNFDPAGLRLAWSPDGELLGAAYAVRRRTAMVGGDLEPERGWLAFFFVVPQARRSGIGRALIGEALDWLRSHRRREVLFSPYTPNYLLPGLDRETYPDAAKLLDALGFTTRYQAVAMDCSLVGYGLPEEVAKRERVLREAGWRIGTPEMDDLVDLVTLAGDGTADRAGAADGLGNPDWARAIREAVVGGLPLDRIVIARTPTGELVGWSMFGAYENVLERFGPFGVREDQRGAGLGKVLLHLALERMRARGAHGAWFLWTGEWSPAGYLYQGSGFSVTRRFDVLRKEL
jgi:GNAT superfamily N-acetyltransferase